MKAQEIAELFQLHALTAMTEALGRGAFVVAGAANCRFYYNSPRYADDLEIEIAGIAAPDVLKRIDQVIRSPLLIRTLVVDGISVESWDQSVQSTARDTWTIALAHQSLSRAVSTRVEISYLEYPYPREASVVEPMSSEMRRAYPHLHLPLVRHYLPAAALEQKIIALKDRSATQPRDVFDLDVLFRAYPDALRSGDIDRSLLSIAIDRTMSISYELYAAKVGAFLEPGLEHLATREHWNALSVSVIDRLEELAR